MITSLITSIDSILMRIDQVRLTFNSVHDQCELTIWLRNLKVLLISRNSELQKVELKQPSTLVSLFFRIEGTIARLLPLTYLDFHMVSEVLHSLGKDVDVELLNAMNQSSLLTSDDLLGISRCILGNSADLLILIRAKVFGVSTAAFEVRDAFEVHSSFLMNFLQFGIQACVELKDLLFHIQPIAINAARFFIKVDDDIKWYKHVESKCSSMVYDSQVYQVYSQALTTSQSQNVDDVILKNFLDSLISLLWDMLRRLDLDSRSKGQFKVLYERLRFCRAILKKDNKDEDFIGQIGALVCDAGGLICSIHQADPVRLSDLLQRFDVFQGQVDPKINPSKANEELIFGDFTNIKISNDGNENSISPVLSSTTPIVGFHDDEVTSILDRLIRGSKQLNIVPICGMAGIGKTTFALKLYNHPSVLHHFWARAQCTVSQVLDKKKVLLQLLNQIQPGDYLELTQDDLADKLRRSLKGKRYLVLLDDVWTPEVFENLKASFPDDSTDSRIMVSSRSLDIAQQPHKLRFRNDNECLDILNVKLMHTKGWNPEIGMKIARLCKGLPLTLVIVAGLLTTTREEGWNGILDQLSSGCVSNSESLLELSFKHLPDYLQPCFLSFGAFPEDEEVSAKMLIRLWMAEGFVRTTEDVGQEYMQKLIERSLVMVSTYRSIGGVKTCRIHDLLHDFCLKKAKQESFFHLLQQRCGELSDFNEPCSLQRLVIRSNPTHFKESRLFCPRAQSMLFFCSGKSWEDIELFDMSFIIQVFPLLTVLDIHHICLTNEIPSEIELLRQLRYLSIQSEVPVIPTSVGKLYNLETFIAFFPLHGEISFPHTLWNLQRLKYVDTENCNFTLPSEDLENFSSLMELETLCGVVFYFDDGSMEKLMRKFPHVRRMKCTIKPREKSLKEFQKIVVPEILSHLELLFIRGYRKLKCEFGSTESLRRVTLEGFQFSREDIANIGKLPNLVVLKLYDPHFQGKTLEMEKGEFPKLRILEVHGSYPSSHPLKRWTASDDQLPCLVRLVLGSLDGLKEIPSCLWTSETLEEIHVIECSSILESLVRDIEEVQTDFGNSIKVHIVSTFKQEYESE